MISTTSVVPDDRARACHLRGSTCAVAATTAALVCYAAVALERAGALGRALGTGRGVLLAPAVVSLLAAAIACERIWPAEKRSVLARGHVHDLLFFVLHILVVVPLMTLLGVAFARLLMLNLSWMEVAWTASWPRWLLLALTLVLMDGANWLAHWSDHRFQVLWRLHAVHHTQEELNVLTSFRAHPLSHLAGFLLASIPVVALLGGRGMAPQLITAYVCLGTLPHANVNWSFGPLGKVIVSPAYHRLHHSYEGSRGLNLGIVLTLWDVLARRATFPAKRDAPCATGLENRPLRTELGVSKRANLGLLAHQLAEPFWSFASHRPRHAASRADFGIARKRPGVRFSPSATTPGHLAGGIARFSVAPPVRYPNVGGCVGSPAPTE